eukprot:g1521.t1
MLAVDSCALKCPNSLGEFCVCTCWQEFSRADVLRTLYQKRSLLPQHQNLLTQQQAVTATSLAARRGSSKKSRIRFGDKMESALRADYPQVTPENSDEEEGDAKGTGQGTGANSTWGPIFTCSRGHAIVTLEAAGARRTKCQAKRCDNQFEHGSSL